MLKKIILKSLFSAPEFALISQKSNLQQDLKIFIWKKPEKNNKNTPLNTWAFFIFKNKYSKHLINELSWINNSATIHKTQTNTSTYMPFINNNNDR